MRLKVQKFDPNTLKPYRIIIMIGKRGTGKSTLIADILYHISQKVDFGVAMTPTEESCSMFREHMPESWIYNTFAANKLEQMLQLQRDLGKKNKIRHLFVVMDDCMYDKKILRGLCMRDLFMNGRHLKVTFLNAMQYIMDMGPDLRTQVDYVFALRENIISNKSKLHKYFFGMFDKYEDFSRVMDRCTENHGCLVLDNTAKTNNLEDCLFWYRASIDLPAFRMGKDIYWKMASQTRKSDDDIDREAEEQELIKRQELLDKKRGQRITCVEKHDTNGLVQDDVQLVIN